MKTIRYGSRTIQKVLMRDTSRSHRLVERVSRIIEDVRVGQDAALLKYTRKFDKVRLSPREIMVSEDEINGCYQDIKPEFIHSLKTAIENVRRFYGKAIKKFVKVRHEDGVLLGERYRPLENLGVYIPAGQAPLISSVYMTVVPAHCAGVENIYLVTPPNQHRTVDPHILAAANLLKVKAVFKAGGAQAIAAMAFGTKTIPRMDKIIGPGNQYVAEAKRQVFGYCDIDMVAGPSELVVLANDHSDPGLVSADMMAQGEHKLGMSILVTTSKRLAKTISKLPCRGFVIRVRNLAQGADLVNQIAPEHLQIMVKQPERVVKLIKNAGAIFLGSFSPTAIGDYMAGPSHVLPTGGSARFFSGLGLRDFLKCTHVISYSRKALEKVRPHAELMAGLEGMKRHYESLKVRFE
ncbi:MAG: histidinol dehydrogenase [Candidatus Omnitrophica bacterium]|nr:histidinol dehydrogenase [Candidatus Omnitrophota bacterium]